MTTKRRRVTKGSARIGTWPTPERPASRKWPVTLKVDIEPEALKRVVEEGRLMEFVEAFSTLAAGQIKGKIVDQLTKAGAGVARAGGGMAFAMGYDIDDPYITGPPGPWPWPPHTLLTYQIKDQVREAVTEVLKDVKGI